MVNEETGRAVALSVWVDEEAMRASDAGADEMRNRVTERSGVKTDTVEYFRLARTVQHGIPLGWRNVASQPHRTEFEGDRVVE